MCGESKCEKAEETSAALLFAFLPNETDYFAVRTATLIRRVYDTGSTYFFTVHL